MSHSVPDIGFLLYLQLFCTICTFTVIKNRFTAVFLKYCDYSSCLGWSILFLYAPPHKGLNFEKLWASLFWDFHIVLKSLVPYLGRYYILGTILISWSPIWISSILLSALKRLASTTPTVLYKSMENRHPWRFNIRIKGSGRKLFVLILDSILVYATLIMWMNFSSYPNLCKTEKIKSALRIFIYLYRKIFIRFILLLCYVTNSIKSG